MLALSANTPNTGYNLTRSLRFRASASAYLSRTPASAGNRSVWTYSDWVKRGQLGSLQSLLSAGTTGPITSIYFSTSDQLVFYTTDSFVSTSESQTTNAVFRDPAASYHVLVSVDTTQATYANRVKIYINGIQQTVTVTNQNTQITQNAQLGVNRTEAHNIGRQPYSATQYFDGYRAETYLVDGQALTPSSFGSTNSTTGVWQPARYTGTYGTNGFYLPFTDNSALTTSSNVGLGKDFSGNGNYWTTNNISITSGVTYDSMTDVPTLTSATAANFAVLNPLDYGGSSFPITNGNLTWSSTTSGAGFSRGTIGMTSGKWYWEIFATRVSGGTCGVGIAKNNSSNFSTGQVMYQSDSGQKIIDGTSTAYGATWSTNNVIGIAYDADAGQITFYKDNASQGAITLTGYAGVNVCPVVADGSSLSFDLDANFGQRPFAYTPPSGFVALNAYNLPDSTIKQGNKVMDATLWTGDSTSPKTITNAAGFKPDLVWVKMRSGAYQHAITDSVRGGNQVLHSNSTSAEDTNWQYGYVQSFNSNGFTAQAGATSIDNYNLSGQTFVGWQWQAGQGVTSFNASGTITSTTSVNASAGFSVVTWNGNGAAGATIGHGLGVAPAFVIAKNRSRAGVSWPVYHSFLAANSNLFLDLTAASTASPSYGWVGGTSSTAVTLNIGSANAYQSNQSGDTYVAYCFAPIAGYSAFGSYTGNNSGSGDGPFVYCGFKPRYIMFKRTDATENWIILDTARDSCNVATHYLLANDAGAEGTYPTGTSVDFLSNGFKIRCTTGLNIGTWVYAAFASNPFKNSLAQ